LCERLELLMASKQAGNTGLRNEIVSICDEHLRQKNLSHDAYKYLMLTLNKDVKIKRGYQRKYQVGGSGIFSKLKDFLSGFISKKQVVDTALNIARSAG